MRLKMADVRKMLDKDAVQVDTGHRANRGAGTEKLVAAAVQLMAEKGGPLLVRVPTEVTVHRKGEAGETKVTGAHFGRRSVSDYVGWMPDGRGVAVEVKSTRDKTLHLLTKAGLATPAVPQHQRNFLDRCLQGNVRAFLLVAFTDGMPGPLFAGKDAPLWYLVPWSWARGERVLDPREPTMASCAAPYEFLSTEMKR